MGKKRNLGHLSAHHGMKAAVARFIDENNITGSLDVVKAAFEYRLDVVEDDTQILDTKFNNLSADVQVNTNDIAALQSDASLLSASVDNVIGDVSIISSSVDNVISDLSTLSSSVDTISDQVISLTSDMLSLTDEVTSLSSSLSTLSSSFTLLSASIGSGGNLNVDIPSDSELYFNGDTLMTDADVYISGSGNNLYLHGTNDQGLPAKFEFSIVSGSTYISEVPHSDFGEEIDDPWFKFDGDTLLTHADIYVSGSNNYLYLNGTDENGDYGIFYFDIVDGGVIVKQTWSIN